ncbi:HWE histidine kinase domain-containing protein [Microvirga pudoricolor]|uniref:HWE histidine kinase domain-containing protein n=1 Tax=Microvirga pudoricolor TaxID=2778729 RepID=UPI00194FC1F5|nr:HWE histidine kinase domain-containing protein [Microvirga pudoricolor]MBM6595701.1 PAS domain-containing protein [Microvirga pudoricolor]
MLEDSDLDFELIADALSRSDLTARIRRVVSREAFQQAVLGGGQDVILADYVVPGFDGDEAFRFALKHAPQTPFIFVSGTLGEDIATEAIKDGASDYVTKHRLDRLPRAIHRALGEARLRKENDRVREDLATKEQALRVSEERLQVALDAAEVVGIWDWDFESDLIHASARFARIYSVDPEMAAIGAPANQYFAHIHPDDLGRLHDAIEEAKAGDPIFQSEYRIRQPDGTVRWVLAKGRIYKNAVGKPVRFPGVAIDVSDQRLAEDRKSRLVDLMDRLRNADTVTEILDAAVGVVGSGLAASRAGIVRLDASGRIATVVHEWCASGAQSIEGRYELARFGRSFVDALASGQPLIAPDVALAPETRASLPIFEALRIKSLINLPLIEQGRLGAVLFVHAQEVRHWTQADVGFVRDVADRMWASAERARAEERQQILINELNHRVKNTLATVQSIVNLTLRKAETLSSGSTAIEMRLLALSQAHNILTRENWDGAELQEIVAESTTAYRSAREDRLHISGPKVRLNPRAALALSMALHELATNAVKYGALSNDTGRIVVQWALERRDARDWLRLRWEEQGGPPVQAPSRRGFGSRLIERSLAQDLDGEAHIDFAPDGVICRVDTAVTLN